MTFWKSVTMHPIMKIGLQNAWSVVQRSMKELCQSMKKDATEKRTRKSSTTPSDPEDTKATRQKRVDRGYSDWFQQILEEETNYDITIQDGPNDKEKVGGGPA